MTRVFNNSSDNSASKRGWTKRDQNSALSPRGKDSLSSKRQYGGKHIHAYQPDGHIRQDGRYTKRDMSGQVHARASLGEGHFATSVRQHKPEFKNDVFASETDYERSVASVIARIKSGEVQPIEPDAE